jgi:hypothetical protein
MTTAQLSSIYKGIVNNSSDEDNALRLWEFARQSEFNFSTVLEEHRQIILAQGHPVYMEVEQDEPDQVDNQSELMDLAEPINTMHAEAQEAVQMEIEQVQNNLFPPGNVTIRSVSKNEMIALNAMSSADRKRAIDRLNLNDVDRTRLVNSLWRLRNPERVRQNSRRSYQNRRLHAQA